MTEQLENSSSAIFAKSDSPSQRARSSPPLSSAVGASGESIDEPDAAIGIDAVAMSRSVKRFLDATSSTCG